MGNFVVKKTDSGFSFNLMADNNEVIATSEVYTTKAACLKGIESVADNAPFAPIEIVLEKEAPLAGRASILLVGVYQPTVEHCSSDVWNGVAKAVK